ncbi:MAG: glycosyltransferase, partial [Flavobacteriales bacterium]|nr:glycosyltransferase [Flavobacteriales bacterium]
GPGLESPFGKDCEKTVLGSEFLRNRVIFTGMLSGDKKWGAFYGCSAFVLPSHQENFGIAVAEALACAKPVLICDKVNIWREIEAGGGGIVKPDNLEGVREILDIWLKLNASQKEEMSRAAVDVYRNHFEINRTITKLVDVLSGNFENDKA